MRTQEEILARIEAVAADDWIGTQRNDLIYALTLENAKPFLKDGVTENDWAEATDESIRQEAVDYMEFVWDKANNFRGLSAGRSMDPIRS